MHQALTVICDALKCTTPPLFLINPRPAMPDTVGALARFPWIPSTVTAHSSPQFHCAFASKESYL